MKFKELDVEKEHLWIMLFNSIKLENLTNFCIFLELRTPDLSLFLYFAVRQMLHGCRKFLFYDFRLISKKNETLILCFNSSIYRLLT
jgi:hypothetical protein